jgi:hypothetical protein
MKEPMLRLFYLTAPHTYSKYHVIAETLSHTWYVPVYECPVREMLSHTCEELAEELIRMTNGGQWTLKLVRPVKYGDMFTMGDTEWLVVPETDAATLKEAGFDVRKLPSWPPVVIVNTQREPETCNS